MQWNAVLYGWPLRSWDSFIASDQHKRYLKDDAKREQEERYKGEVAVSRDQLCKAIGCEVDEPLHWILQHDVAKRDTYQEEHYAYENEWNGCFFLFIIQSRRDKGP